jgi:hypothetical protein
VISCFLSLVFPHQIEVRWFEAQGVGKVRMKIKPEKEEVLKKYADEVSA